MSDIGWSVNNEDFSYESLDELLLCHEKDIGDTVYFGAKKAASTKWIDAHFAIETISERAFDEYGEYAEDFPDVSDEARKELEDFLEAWQSKNCATSFFTVPISKEYVITEDDLEK